MINRNRASGNGGSRGGFQRDRDDRGGRGGFQRDRDDRGGRGGFQRDRDDRGDRGGFQRDRDDRRSQMFATVCDDCGSECEVPFKPSGDKPVYCNNCFKSESRSKPRHDQKHDNEQLIAMNEKLDRLVNLVNGLIIRMEKPAASPAKAAKTATKAAPKKTAKKPATKKTVKKAVKKVTKGK